MITITRVYEAKKEFKLVYSTLRSIKANVPIKYRELQCTSFIDYFFTHHIKEIHMKDKTRKQLYRFAIAYRYRIVNEIK